MFNGFVARLAVNGGQFDRFFPKIVHRSSFGAWPDRGLAPGHICPVRPFGKRLEACHEGYSGGAFG